MSSCGVWAVLDRRQRRRSIVWAARWIWELRGRMSGERRAAGRVSALGCFSATVRMWEKDSRACWEVRMVVL